MTYDEKVRWLRRYQDSLRRERELAEEVELLRSRAYKVTHALTGMPGGPSDGQALPRAVEEILEAQQELEKQIEQCNTIRREVANTIEQITSPKENEIFRRRYILGQTWEDIAEHIDISTRWVQILHRKQMDSD